MMLSHEGVREALWLENAGHVESLITGVGSQATARRRSKTATPGRCFEMAGWKRLEKSGSIAEVWWRMPVGSTL